jgi:uncharacterized glyoxalase superfamily protein PhnB
MKPNCTKLSPVLVVDAIEPALPFWTGRLGFAVTVQVPLAEGRPDLGFAILQQGAVEVMLQTRASVAGDVPALAKEPNRATLYVEVADIEAVARAVQGLEIVVPRRTTFYGADEIGVRAPGGHVVLFAQHAR